MTDNEQGLSAAQQRISVIMANFNGERHIRQALRSVLDQTHDNLELIVSDDGSSDASRRIVYEEMALDPRIRLIEAPAPSGPAGARNRALEIATGDWVAIVDSDDIIHPERLARLLQSAMVLGADLVADDLVFFGDDPLESQGTLLRQLALKAPQEFDAVALISGRLLGAENLSLGYLKPLIRRGALGQTRYNENLRIDEDCDLYLRLLLGGARFMLIPDALYLYRRHPLSTSHRLGVASLERMIAAQAAVLRDQPPEREDLIRAITRRMKLQARELSHVRTMEALKAGDWLAAAGRLLRNPRNILSLMRSVKERVQRQLRRRDSSGDVRATMNLVLCQRGQVVPTEYSGFEVFEVPAVKERGWAASAAETWMRLARLACKHDLDIIAIDRAGEFALGLVPRFGSAKVVYPAPTAADVRPPGSAEAAAQAIPVVQSARSCQEEA